MLNRVYSAEFMARWHASRHLLNTFDRKLYRAFDDSGAAILSITNGRRMPSRERFDGRQDKHPFARLSQIHNIAIGENARDVADKAALLEELETLWAVAYPQVVDTEHECRLWVLRGEIQEGFGDTNARRSYIAAVQCGYGGESANDVDVDRDGTDGWDAAALEAFWHCEELGVTVEEALA